MNVPYRRPTFWGVGKRLARQDLHVAFRSRVRTFITDRQRLLRIDERMGKQLSCKASSFFEPRRPVPPPIDQVGGATVGALKGCWLAYPLLVDGGSGRKAGMGLPGLMHLDGLITHNTLGTSTSSKKKRRSGKKMGETQRPIRCVGRSQVSLGLMKGSDRGGGR